VIGRAARLPDSELIARFHRVARGLGHASVDGDVAVTDELPRLRPRLGEAGAVDGVVETPLEVDEQRLAGGTGHLGGTVERVLHLPLENAVHASRLLLLAKLQREVGDLAPRCWCMPGGDERFSNVHLVKHFSPLRKSFIPSRRQIRQTGPVYLAI